MRRAACSALLIVACCGGDPPNLPPVALAQVDSTRVGVGQRVTLLGANSSDPEGDALSFEWTLLARPEASSTEIRRPDSGRAELPIDVAGRYGVRLVVRDALSSSAPSDLELLTENRAPLLVRPADREVAVGATVELSAEGSDPDGDPVSFRWRLASLPPGSAAGLSAASGPRTSLVADAAGVFRVALEGSDGSASAEALIWIFAGVSNTAPVAEAGPDQRVGVGTPALLDASASSDADGQPLSFGWRLTTSPPGSRAAVVPVDVRRAALSPDVAGRYTVELIADDGLARSAPDTVSITGTACPPPQVVRDGEFAESDWVVDFEVDVVASATQKASRSSSDGAPGAYRLMRHEMRNPLGGPAGINAYHVYLRSTYDPAVFGAIDRIDYAEYRRRQTGGVPVSGGFVVLQNGTRFVAPLRGGAGSFTNVEWAPVAIPGLRAAEFGSTRPDFSATAAPLRFGYMRRTSTPGGEMNVEHGIDGWTVTVHPECP